MITEEPKVSDDSMFGMTEAARVIGVSYETMRRYVYNGDIRTVFHNGQRKRKITGKELKRFWKGK